MRNLVIPRGVIVLCAACALNKLSIVKDIGSKMDEHATEEAERIIRENPKFADLA